MSRHLDDADEWLALGSATVYEASGRDCFLPPRLRPVWRGASLVGRALPVHVPAGDNLGLHCALEQAEPGDVLVVDAEQGEFGYWGEVLTVAAQQRGVLGMVIDGGVRDVDQLEALAFPVFSSSVALRTTIKRSAGTVGEPMSLGHVLVEQGDVVVADIDGVVVIPTAAQVEVLASARARAAAEQGYLERLRAGELTLDIYPFRSIVEAGNV